MGIPMVTCPGETFASRQSLSHLANAGVPGTIARDHGHYVDLAVGLESDPERQSELRASLRPRTAASPLCVELRERCFTPAVTLGLFVSQALSRAEPCSTVVTKFNRERKRKHLPPVCEDASAYCRARAKLPVELMDRLSHRVVEKTCPHGREQAEF